jgi:uncharacterized protein (UPF0332 family)
VSPEATVFVEHANTILARANVMLNAGLNEDAARAAYLAAFHVAQAYIFERTGKAFKTHNGVHREFARLAMGDQRIDAELRRFLPRAYEFRSVADYFSGPNPVTAPEAAAEALETAHRFVVHFTQHIPPANP